MSSRRALTMLAASASALVLLLTSGGVANAVNPESAPRKPGQDAGHFLGHPTPTYQWHKCTATSVRKTPTDPPPEAGLPTIPRGNKQKKVTWSVVESSAADSGWVVKWEVAQGWRICGVQVAVRGSHPDLDADLAMMAGYTSTATKGTTVKSGGETIKVSISKHEANMGGLPRINGGKKYVIEDIYSVVVFIAKKK